LVVDVGRDSFSLKDILVDHGLVAELQTIYNRGKGKADAKHRGSDAKHRGSSSGGEGSSEGGVEGEDMYDDRIEESMELENITMKELNMMMQERNEVDQMMSTDTEGNALHHSSGNANYKYNIGTTDGSRSYGGSRHRSHSGSSDGLHNTGSAVTSTAVGGNSSSGGSDGSGGSGGSGGGSGSGASSVFSFSVVEWCMIGLIPLLTFLGHWAMDQIDFYYIRCICILISALSMTILQYFIFDEGGGGGGGEGNKKKKRKNRRGIIFLILCFQWACVVAEVYRMVNTGGSAQVW